MNKTTRSLSFQHARLENFSQKEWIVSNGIGGYASSSLCGMNTRRYHGLLVASMSPPVNRRVLLSRVEEEIEVEGNWEPLYTNQYPGTIHPKGYTYLKEFSRFPLPTFCFSVNEIDLVKRIGMVQGSSTTVISYHNPGETSINLKLRPQFVDRDFHHLFYASDEYNFHTDCVGDYIKTYPRYHGTLICLGFQGGAFQHEGAWYKQIEYLKEQDRGLDFSEDTYSPGYISFTVNPGETKYLVCSLDEAMMNENPENLMESQILGYEDSLAEENDNSWKADLTRTADQFVVKRKSSGEPAILAGYPWFGAWGRDSIIAMRGLLLARGKFEETRCLLNRYLSHLDKGLVPNCFPEECDFPEYTSADTSLWLFIALYEYVQKTQDWDFVQECLPRLSSILDAYIQGTLNHIHLTKEGLIYAGSPNSQLTWMDSYMWGYSVTPRWGCPVEINALWYNALKIFELLSQELGESQATYLPFISLIEENFRKYFWHPLGYLYDVVIPGEQRDESIRPNQVFALSLPFKLLSREDGNKVLQQVKQHLYTSKGLRSLSPYDSEFKATYQGNLWERNTAYHQGTVWSFLLPEYLEAFLWIHGKSEEAKRWVENALYPLKEHFYEEGAIGGISEIFHGGEPTTGRGCTHQAKSVGNLLHLINTHNLFRQSFPVQQVNVAIPV